MATWLKVAYGARVRQASIGIKDRKHRLEGARVPKAHLRALQYEETGIRNQSVYQKMGRLVRETGGWTDRRTARVRPVESFRQRREERL